jgi:hypothetical protein
MNDKLIPPAPNSSELVKHALGRLPTIAEDELREFALSPSTSAEQQFWAAVVIEESGSGENDSIVDNALTLALQGNDRLTKERSPDLYWEALLRLARLQLKYKKWMQARQLLSLIAHEGAPLPGWASNYLAKVLYETDSDFAYNHPEKILDHILAGASTTEYLHHSSSVFREFLEKAKEDLGAENGRYNYQLTAFQDSIRKYLKDRPQLKARPSSRLVDAAAEEAIEADFSTLSDAENSLKSEPAEKISALEEEIGSLRARIESLSTENIRLYLELQQIKQVADEGISDLEDNELPSDIDRISILILGASRIKESDIQGICKRFGLTKSNVKLIDFDGSKTLDIDKWRYNCPFHGIMVGPTPHSTTGAKGYSSVIQRLKVEEGFPPTVDVRNESGELKISKSSFRKALHILLDKVGAIYPDAAIG